MNMMMRGWFLVLCNQASISVKRDLSKETCTIHCRPHMHQVRSVGEETFRSKQVSGIDVFEHVHIEL
jgi:hypothetical protein